MWAPLWAALIWLGGTFGAFWLTGPASAVTNPLTLTVFVLAATGAFALGYVINIKRRPRTCRVAAPTWPNIRGNRRLVLVGAVYLALFGAVQMLEYGATDLGTVVERIKNPASAYQAKFDVYELQQATTRVSLPMQAITLAGGLYGVAGPLLVVFWRKLTLSIRVIGVLGLLVYGLFFLFIGTQKGLGDIVVMLLAGVLAGTCGTWWTRRNSEVSRRAGRYAVLAVVAFLIYMVSAQSQRSLLFGTQDVTPPSPVVASVIGQRAATGVAATLFYPTHGYLGLSHNLGTRFEWTEGLGSSQVISSYASQYLGVVAPRTYPVRTEERTGWPAGQYWATIYPWLASDLSFPGAILFMGLFGWLFAKMWVEGSIKRDILALVIFGQLAVAVAYVPANNQLGGSRPITIGFVTLMLLYAARAINSIRAVPAVDHIDSTVSRIP